MLRVLALEETVQGYLGYGVQGVDPAWKPAWQRDPRPGLEGNGARLALIPRIANFGVTIAGSVLPSAKRAKTDLLRRSAEWLLCGTK
jgi:hypothetical protein